MIAHLFTVVSATLPNAGQGVNPIIPIVGGILLLLGVGAFIFAQVSRRKKI